MHPLTRTAAAGLMLAGFLSTTATAHAAAPVSGDPGTPPGFPGRTGTVHMLDCAGTTGARGCGPGWIWHDGWRGYGCYPC